MQPGRPAWAGSTRLPLQARRVDDGHLHTLDKAIGTLSRVLSHPSRRLFAWRPCSSNSSTPYGEPVVLRLRPIWSPTRTLPPRGAWSHGGIKYLDPPSCELLRQRQKSISVPSRGTRLKIRREARSEDRRQLASHAPSLSNTVSL